MAELYESMPTRPVFPGVVPDDLAPRFDEPLPRAGTDADRLVTRVGRDVFGSRR